MLVFKRRTTLCAWALAGLLLGCACPGLWAATPESAFKEGPWPFRPPQRPAVPTVQNAAWVANPIDAFILHALEAQGLQPNPPADKLTLLRRVSFDLTGLPPTRAEQETFLADDAPDAYARLVDRLLDSPHYGQRWAQHWLDVVRYAETDGFKEDALRPNAYRYRDYVIRAFNADLPYNRFIRQQLAGDELEPDNPEALVATGLNRLYPDEYNAANVLQRRQEIHDDLTDNTALAFLGLTIGCAQCHDHKFDPITQVDYFRLQAFFAPLLPRDDVTIASPAEQAEHARQQAAWEDATREIRQELESLVAERRAAVFKDSIQKFDADIRAVLEKPEAERTALERQIVFQAMKHVQPKLNDLGKWLKDPAKTRYAELQKRLAEFDHLKPKPLPTALTVSDAGLEPPPTHRLTLGDYRKPLERVDPGFPAFLGANEPAVLPPNVPANSTGRRAALALWLSRPDHPLTARVMVNRLWQHHFGLGIVPTPNDFGAMGEPASHPELLDWLASEFVEGGWSLKAMHRLMVTSAAYRQSSAVDFDNPQHARALELDGSNRLLWHARRRRLEGEAIRDSMLAVSGQLAGQFEGPSARPELPKGIDGKLAWKPDDRVEQRNRRSIFVLAKRNLRYPLLEIFDLPDMHNSCATRTTTTTAPQALALMNSELTLEQAQHWSGRLLAEHGTKLDAVIQAAFRQAFGRPATNDQVRAAEEFLAQQSASLARENDASVSASLPVPMPAGYRPAEAAAVVDFCHALLNANEFLYVD